MHTICRDFVSKPDSDKLKLILHGTGNDNEEILADIVQKFILSTKRFSIISR